MQPEQGRQPIDDRIRIEHMREAAQDINKYISGRARADLESDSMLLRALTNAVQEIGEAAAHLSDAGRARVPSIPWGQIVAMRHILVHVYWGVDHDRLWSTATLDVPILLAALEEACRQWPLPPPMSQPPP